MKITWYGHSCFRIETGGSVVLIDPFLKGNPTFQKSGIAFEAATRGVTHVALTHGHDDHIGDAGEICKASGAQLFATYELALHVQGKGAEQIQPMNTGGSLASDDFTLTLVDALHSSSSGGIYLGNPNGIVLKSSEGPVVYHMGDTDMFPGMGLINEFHKPDVGIVPIGDRFTMGGKAAAFACRKFFQFKAVLPCHYATFEGMLDPDASKFQAAMEGSGQKVHVPACGETVSV